LRLCVADLLEADVNHVLHHIELELSRVRQIGRPVGREHNLPSGHHLEPGYQRAALRKGEKRIPHDAIATLHICA